MCRLEPLFCRSLGKLLCTEVADIRRIRLLPTRRIRRQHSDGNLRRSLCVPIAQAARVDSPLNGFGGGEKSFRGEFMLRGDPYNFAYRLGALFWSDRSRMLEM